MIDDIYVSDLFGLKPSNNSLMIVIHTNGTNNDNLFIKIASDKNTETNIWTYNMQEIKKHLEDRQIDISYYLRMGDVLIKKKVIPNIIILCNKSICSKPSGFDIIMEYDNGQIIRPYTESNTNIEIFTKIYSFGLYWVSKKLINNKHNEYMENIGIIPSDLLMSIKKSNNDNVLDTLDTSEFDLLGVTSIGLYAINRNKFTDNNSRRIKILNSENKCITNIGNTLKTRQNQKSLIQSFSYNAQGELMTDGKCLTQNNNNVTVETCSNNNKQKWIMTKNKIFPSNDFGKCIEASALDDSIYLRNCDSLSLNQTWSTEDDSFSDMTTDPTWDKYNGKTVVLVENDNPWFINTDTAYNIKFKQPQLNLSDDVKYRQNADVISNFVMDPNRPDMGYGYSFADREGISCNKIDETDIEKKIEGFGGIVNNNDISMRIIILIISISLLLFLYKYWKNN